MHLLYMIRKLAFDQEGKMETQWVFTRKTLFRLLQRHALSKNFLFFKQMINIHIKTNLSGTKKTAAKETNNKLLTSPCKNPSGLASP